MTAPLFDIITVHCFACRHVAQAVTPQEAHDAMERHYEEAHAALLRRLTR